MFCFYFERKHHRQSSSKSLLSQLSLEVPVESLNPSQCFSVIFRGDWTLDLMVLEGDRNIILDALDTILETYAQVKRKVSNDVLLLRYVWLDADKVRV